MRRRLAVAAAVAVGLALTVAGALRWRERRIVERSHTVAEAVRRVAKLATVEMSLSNWHLRRDSRDLHRFIPIRCEKTVAVFYKGKVAAGFDLGGADGLGLGVELPRGEARVEVRLPPPRLLFTDVAPPEVVVADGSLCNRVTGEDYTTLHQEARAAIEREAIAAGALVKAEAHARQLLAEVLRPLGYEVEVTIAAPPLTVQAR